MLFDLSPKTSRKDFYNFESELELLLKFYQSSRVVAVVGPRRVGKTSLLLTFLNEFKVPYIFVDCRRVALSVYGVNFRSFVEELNKAVNDFLNRYGGRSRRLLDYLSKVKGVEVDTPLAKLTFKWGRRDRLDVVDLIEKVNSFGVDEGMRIALVFDELQELQPLNIDFSKLIAYIYDHLKNVVVMVSGSQVGLLYDMLKVEDPRSPLYGRAVAEVSMGRLPKEKAVDFLVKGFREAGLNVDIDVVEKAVNMLDGVIGWLTFFGWSYINGVHDLDEIIDIAAKQEAEELKRFLSRTRSERRYRAILKTVVEGRGRWSEIKKSLELYEGMEIDDKNFNELLKKLVKAGFIEKKGDVYTVADPVMVRAIQRYL